MPRVFSTRDMAMVTIYFVDVAVLDMVFTDLMLSWREGWARSMVRSVWMDVVVCWFVCLMRCLSEAGTLSRVCSMLEAMRRIRSKR